MTREGRDGCGAEARTQRWVSVFNLGRRKLAKNGTISVSRERVKAYRGCTVQAAVNPRHRGCAKPRSAQESHIHLSARVAACSFIATGSYPRQRNLYPKIWILFNFTIPTVLQAGNSRRGDLQSQLVCTGHAGAVGDRSAVHFTVLMLCVLHLMTHRPLCRSTRRLAGH